MSNLGDLMKARRVEMGVSLEHIARLSGITKSHVWDLECGHPKAQNPSIETIGRLCHAFNAAPKEFLTAAYEDWRLRSLAFREVILSKRKTS